MDIEFILADVCSLRQCWSVFLNHSPNVADVQLTMKNCPLSLITALSYDSLVG